MTHHVQISLVSGQDKEVKSLPHFFDDVDARMFLTLPNMSSHIEILRTFFNSNSIQDPEKGDYAYYVLTKDKLSKLIDVLTDHKWKWIEDRDKNERFLFELNKHLETFDFEGKVLLTISWSDK